MSLVIAFVFCFQLGVIKLETPVILGINEAQCLSLDLESNTVIH